MPLASSSVGPAASCADATGGLGPEEEASVAKQHFEVADPISGAQACV